MISRSARRRLLVFGFWPLFGVFGAVQIQLSMLDHGHSWARMIAYQGLVWSLWIGVTFAIVALVRRVPLRTLRPGAFLIHGFAALVLGALHILAWTATEFVLIPYDFMNPVDFGIRLAELGFYQMPLEITFYAFVVLAAMVDEASARARARERTAARLETSLAEARLHALELQTQPHFLFNTLNGISSLVRAGENKNALAMIGGLSELLRYALDRAGGAQVPLEEEVRTVTRYLEIERLRFPDRLSFDVDIAPGLPRAAVPALLLQPLVENAVRHGLAKSDAPGRIALSAVRDGDDVVLEIFNTGRLDPLRRDGIGLANTTARLAQLYGAHAGLTLDARDGGVVARVHLPWSEATR